MTYSIAYNISAPRAAAADASRPRRIDDLLQQLYGQGIRGRGKSDQVVHT